MTSGVRIGTPAITRRGFKEAESKELTGWICDILDDASNPAVIERVKGQILALCTFLFTANLPNLLVMMAESDRLLTGYMGTNISIGGC